jgi:hypothetical protein
MTLLEENIAKLAYKTSKVRDTGDEMAQDLQDFAQKDNYDSLLTNNIKNVAYCLSAIEDHRDLNVFCLEFIISFYNVSYLRSKILT